MLKILQARLNSMWTMNFQVFKLDIEKAEESESDGRLVMSNSLQPHGPYISWNSPGQNTGVGSLSLLQGIFPNPGIKPRSPGFQVNSLPAEPQGNPRILELVAYPFSSRSSWLRNQTRVSRISGRFFTNWAMREDLKAEEPEIKLPTFTES